MQANWLTTSVKHNIGDINAILPEYKALSGKTDYEVLTKQGGKLGREMFFQLRLIRPEKGSIRNDVLTRIKAGKFIKIRDSVREAMTEKWGDKIKGVSEKKVARFHANYWGEETPGQLHQKYLFQQKLVAREIAVRESGRGVLSVSSKYPSTIKDAMEAFSRYHSVLSGVKVGKTTYEQFASFVWRGQDKRAQSVLEGIQRSRGAEAINKAIIIVRDDIMLYILPRRAEATSAAIGKGLKARVS